jgi:hypothetical protein
LFVAVIAVAIAIQDSAKQQTLAVASNTETSLQRPAPASLAFPASDSILASRHFFPYSVVPGGVENAQELRNALAHDPLVAAHYADFDLAKTRVVQLDRDRFVYLSYRMGNHIYWMTKKLELHRGESLLTDGKNEARTRCGNRISDLPIDLVSPRQPKLEAFEAEAPPLPSAEKEDLVGFPAGLVPASAASIAPESGAPFVAGGTGGPAGSGGTGASGGSGGLIPPGYFPIVGGGPSYPNSPYVVPPPVVTPEPGTRPLLAIGLLALLAAGTAVRIRQNKIAP